MSRMSGRRAKQHRTRADTAIEAGATPRASESAGLPAAPCAPQPPPTWREFSVALVLAAAAAALFVWPVLGTDNRWGINDWDQHQLYYGFARWSLVERHQWPFWNPFMCGGNPAFANPQSFSGSPLSALLLPLEDLLGLRLLVWFYAALGTAGAWLFGRRVGCSRIAAWLPGAAFGLGSTYALHVATGHSTWFAMAWLPFALTALHAAFTRASAAILAGAAAALVFYGGNANLFVWLFVVCAAWAAAQAVARRSYAPLAALALMAASGAGFAAAKLVPMAHFLSRVTAKEVADASSGNLDMLWNALLGREQTLRAYEQHAAGITWRFWEYGAYVGPALLVGAAWYVATHWRRAAPLAALALASLWIALGYSHGAWDLLRILPGFSSIRVPSRAIVFAPLAIATLAALLVTEWEHRLPRLAVFGIVALVIVDITWVSRKPLHEALVVEPQQVARAAFEQVDGKRDFRSGWDPVARRYFAPYSDMYPAFLAGRGTINCYDRLHLPVFAVPARRRGGAVDPRWRGEARLESGGSATLAQVGGSRLIADVEPTAAGRLILNQNWAPGWTTLDARPALDVDGLLAADVKPGDRKIVFQYAPPGLGSGAALSLLTILAWPAFALFRRRSARPSIARRPA